MIDRGRRLYPKNGKFGSITITNEQATLRPTVAYATTAYATWGVTDADLGKLPDVTANGSDPNPTFTWNSANGGEITTKFPAVMTQFSCRNQNLTSITMKGAKKWSNFTSFDADTNQLTEVTTYEWPALITLDLQIGRAHV